MVFCVLASSEARAQQNPAYTQYMYNTQLINPAYTGSRGLFGVNVLHRSQWSGVDGAPSTQTVSVSSPLGRNIGLGLTVFNDRIGNGANNTTDFAIDFSYGVPVSDEGTLSFGLKAGGSLLSTDFNKLRHFQPSLLLNNQASREQKFSPNVGLGVYYYTNTFYAGISIPKLLRTDFFKLETQNATYLAKDSMRVYGILGWVMPLGRGWEFKPAILVNTSSGEPINVDISANFKYDKRYVIGAAYRYDAAVSLLTGFQLTDHLMIGLSYDRETTDFGGIQYNDGTFEVFLRYEIFFKKRRIVGARFF